MMEEGINILQVEDSRADAVLVKKILDRSKLKTTISVVSDGEKALDYLFHRGDYEDMNKYPRPDLVLLDLRLPKLDGTGVLKRIREQEHLKDLPVVIFTSSERDEDIIRTYEDGAGGYLLKSAFAKKSTKMEGLLDIILSLT